MKFGNVNIRPFTENDILNKVRWINDCENNKFLAEPPEGTTLKQREQPIFSAVSSSSKPPLSILPTSILSCLPGDINVAKD